MWKICILGLYKIFIKIFELEKKDFCQNLYENLEKLIFCKTYDSQDFVKYRKPQIIKIIADNLKFSVSNMMCHGLQEDITFLKDCVKVVGQRAKKCAKSMKSLKVSFSY